MQKFENYWNIVATCWLSSNAVTGFKSQLFDCLCVYLVIDWQLSEAVIENEWMEDCSVYLFNLESCQGTNS